MLLMPLSAHPELRDNFKHIYTDIFFTKYINT